MVEWVKSQARLIAGRIKTDGLFDIVICDSVLNSVISAEAKSDVIYCCAAFLKPGGTLFISGRKYADQG
jgi:ParB family chromosome partitioning protein